MGTLRVNPFTLVPLFTFIQADERTGSKEVEPWLASLRKTLQAAATAKPVSGASDGVTTTAKGSVAVAAETGLIYSSLFIHKYLYIDRYDKNTHRGRARVNP